MPDFAFYREAYGGSRIEGGEALERLLLFAEDMLAGYERRYTVSYPTPDARDKALCAIADERALTEWAAEEGRVKSVSAGSVSTTYETEGRATLLEEEGARCYRTACRYADIYRGAL